MSRPSHPALAVLVVALTLATPAPVRAQAGHAAADGYAEALTLLADGHYTLAAEALSEVRHAEPEASTAAWAWYYEAEARLAAGQEAEALALLEAFERAHPAHPLAGRARLALGQFLFASGRYAEAEAALLDAVADGAATAAQTARAHYWIGEARLRQDDADGAVAAYRAAVAADPRGPTAALARYAAGRVQIGRGNYADAARLFEALAAEHPHSPYAQNIGLALAEAYYELGDWARVVEETERRAATMAPEAQERAWFLRAEAHNHLQQRDDAIIYYRRLTEERPQSPYHRPALYGLAWNYHFQEAYQWAGDAFARVHEGYDDALAARAQYYEAANRRLEGRREVAAEGFDRVFVRWPEHPLAPQALLEAALARYEMREWEAARAALDRLIETYPEADQAGEAYYMLGNTLVALGKAPAALQAFDEAIARDAAPPALAHDMRFQRAWLLYRQERWAAAAEAFAALAESDGARAADALFWGAESLYQIDRFDEAARRFRRYLEAYPRGQHAASAQYALGWVAFRQGDYARAASAFEALDAYERRGAALPFRTDARLRLADSYYALKRYRDAIRIYRDAAADGDDYALFQIGQAFSNSGDAFSAIQTFRRLLAETPESAWREEAQYQLGYLFFQNQDYASAIEAYRRVVQMAPRDPLAAKALYGIGDAYYNAGDLDRAVDAYRDVLQRYPQSPFAADAAAGIQYALLALDQPQRAQAVVDSFIAANPGSPIAEELRFRQADVLMQRGDEAAARAAYTRFLQDARNPALVAQARYGLAQLLRRTDPDAAVARLQAVVAERPPQPIAPEAARLLGEIEQQRERHGAAADAFARWGALAPDAPTRQAAAARQAAALVDAGRLAEAERVLSAAASDDPTPALSLALGRVYQAQRRNAEAEQAYRRAIDRSDDAVGAEALVRLGVLQLESGLAARAVETLGRITTLFPAHPDWVAQGLFVQARAFETLGRRGDAQRVYRRLVDEFPDTDAATQAREVLDA